MIEPACKIKVRYAETDQMGVVYYANYFVWMEVARTSWFERVCGVGYHKVEEDGLFLPVVDTSCKYISAIRYPEEVEIYLKCWMEKRLYLCFDYEFLVEGQKRAYGHSRHIFMDKLGKVRRIPREVINKIGDNL